MQFSMKTDGEKCKICVFVENGINPKQKMLNQHAPLVLPNSHVLKVVPGHGTVQYVIETRWGDRLRNITNILLVRPSTLEACEKLFRSCISQNVFTSFRPVATSSHAVYYLVVLLIFVCPINYSCVVPVLPNDILYPQAQAFIVAKCIISGPEFWFPSQLLIDQTWNLNNTTLTFVWWPIPRSVLVVWGMHQSLACYSMCPACT